MGTLALAIGVIILSQDLIVEEKQSGVAEWLLSKPVARRSFILSKLVANVIATFLLLILIPSLLVYGLFFLRAGETYPLQPFLAGVGIMSLHTLFYLTMTLMAGTFFNNRAPILAVTLGSLMGGLLLGGFAEVLLYVSPWALTKTASAVAAGAPLPVEMQIYPLFATGLWCILFVVLAVWKFERTEF
jgi:ABC-2 type transport system permease protein